MNRAARLIAGVVACILVIVAAPVHAAQTTSVTFHFKPTSNNTRDWHIWAWDDANAGRLYAFTGTDTFGKTLTVTYDHAVSTVGFIVTVDNAAWVKDVEMDRFINNPGSTTDVWLTSGDERIFTSLASATNPGPQPKPAQPSWLASAVIYEVNLRQYTSAGTFKAFAQQLPRLKSLGVDALWLMPIFPISKLKRSGTLGSPYAPASYTSVNPDFGTSTDFANLVKQAHSLGFKVILDWVANHTGWDHLWIKSHPDWYTQDDSGNIISPAGTNWLDVADLNYDNANMRTAMIAAMKSWVTKYGIDGFRCDFASGVPTSFWESATKQLNAIKPLFMLAEDDSVPSLLNTAFVANYAMNFNGMGPTSGLMYNIARNTATKNDFKMAVLRLKSWYPSQTYPMMYITNHDQNAWWGTEFEKFGNAVNQLAAMEFTFAAIPMLYSGQEVGMSKRLDFFNKDTIVWPASSSWTPFYQKLIDLKKKNPALYNGVNGGPMVLLSNTNDNVISYSRTKGSNTVITVLNISKQQQTVTVNTGLASTYMYRFSDGAKVLMSNQISLTIPARGFAIYSSVAPTVK